MWDSPRERPEHFTLDPYASLHEGLVFAGLGGGGSAKSLRYVDSSLFGNHGTLTNMDPPTDWVWDSYLGRWATDYDGSNDIVLLGDPDDGKYQFASGFSVGAWVYPISVGQYDCVVVDVSSVGDGWRIWTRDASSQQWYWECDDGATKNTKTTSGITLNTWQHVMGVHDGTNLVIYKNGIAEGTPAAVGAVDYTGTQRSLIGGMPNDAAATTFQRFIKARISDPCIYNRVLSHSEIARLADPSNVMLSGLILPPRRRIFPAAAVGVSRPAHVIGGGIAA